MYLRRQQTNMYSEWASLSAQITANSCGAQCFSVLNKFPASAGREVVISVVKQLGTNLGITQNAEPSHLVKDEEASAPYYICVYVLIILNRLNGVWTSFVLDFRCLCKNTKPLRTASMCTASG